MNNHKLLIYIIAIFVLWLYFKYGSFGDRTQSQTEIKNDSGRGGTFPKNSGTNFGTNRGAGRIVG